MENTDHCNKAYCPWLDDSPTSLRSNDAQKQPKQRTIPKRMKKLIDEDLAAVSGNRESTRDRLKEKLRRKKDSGSKKLQEFETPVVQDAAPAPTSAPVLKSAPTPTSTPAPTSAPVPAATDAAHKSTKRKKRRRKVKKGSAVAEREVELDFVNEKEVGLTEKGNDVTDSNKVDEAELRLVDEADAPCERTLIEMNKENEVTIEYTKHDGVLTENASGSNDENVDKEIPGTADDDAVSCENPLDEVDEGKEYSTTSASIRDSEHNEDKTDATFVKMVDGQNRKHTDDIVKKKIVECCKVNSEEASLVPKHFAKRQFSKRYSITSAHLKQLLRRNRAIDQCLSDTLIIVTKMKAEIERLKILRFPILYKIKEKIQLSWIQSKMWTAISLQEFETNQVVQYGSEMQNARQYLDIKKIAKCSMIKLSGGTTTHHVSILAQQFLVSKMLKMALPSENVVYAFLSRPDHKLIQNEVIKNSLQKMHNMPLWPDLEKIYFQMKRTGQYALLQRNFEIHQRNLQMSLFRMLSDEVDSKLLCEINTAILPSSTMNKLMVPNKKIHMLSIGIGGTIVLLQFTDIIIDKNPFQQLVTAAFSQPQNRVSMSQKKLAMIPDVPKKTYLAFIGQNKLILSEFDSVSSTLRQLFEIKICDVDSILVNKMNTDIFEMMPAAKMMQKLLLAISCLAPTKTRPTMLKRLESSWFDRTPYCSFYKFGNVWYIDGQLSNLLDSVMIIKTGTDCNPAIPNFKIMYLPKTDQMKDRTIAVVYRSAIQYYCEIGFTKSDFAVSQSGLTKPILIDEKNTLTTQLQLHQEFKAQNVKSIRSKWKTLKPKLKEIMSHNPALPSEKQKIAVTLDAKSKADTVKRIKGLRNLKLIKKQVENKQPLNFVTSSVKKDPVKDSSTKTGSGNEFEGRQENVQLKDAKDTEISDQKIYLQRSDRNIEIITERTRKDFRKEIINFSLTQEDTLLKLKKTLLILQKTKKNRSGVTCMENKEREMKLDVEQKEQTEIKHFNPAVAIQSTKAYIAQLHELMKKAESFEEDIHLEIKTHKINYSMMSNPHTGANYFRRKQKGKYGTAVLPNVEGNTQIKTMKERNDLPAGTESVSAENCTDAQNNTDENENRNEQSGVLEMIEDSEQTHYGLRLCIFDEVLEERNEHSREVEKLENCEQTHFGIRLCIFD